MEVTVASKVQHSLVLIEQRHSLHGNSA